MFEREAPSPSDANLSHFYGLALPLVKRGLPVAPVQLENVPLPGFLDSERVLLLSYQGQKPLSAEVHPALAEWVKRGGVLIVVDDDSDPFNAVREWWNEEGKMAGTARGNLFEALGVKDANFAGEGDGATVPVGKGAVRWVKESPVALAGSAEGDARLAGIVRAAVEQAGVPWRETNGVALRRGPYLIGAGLDESVPGEAKTLQGRFVNLFDPELKVQTAVTLTPGARVFLLDLDAAQAAGPTVLASACRAVPVPGKRDEHGASWTVEGVGDTPAVVLIAGGSAPKAVRLEGKSLEGDAVRYDEANRLLSVRFSNEARGRELSVEY